jgi:NADH-quinone oxidoreductase subunit C
MDVRQPIPTNGGDWITKFGEAWATQAARLKEKFGDKIEEVRMPPAYPTDVPIIFVKKDSVIEILKFVKEESGFEYGFLADLTATDELNEMQSGGARFEVVYNLFSQVHKHRIRIKVRVPENEEVPTAVSVWKGANWAEREVYDMFGIKFKGHPDLRRILMDERWVGHPLRKDYPLRGYQIFTEPQVVDPTLLE